MSSRALSQDAWEGYFQAMTRSLKASNVSVNIVSAHLGDQTEIDNVLLHGMSYSARSDQLSIYLQQANHVIFHPQSIWVDDQINGLRTVMVIDAERNQHLITFQDVLELNPPRKEINGE